MPKPGLNFPLFHLAPKARSIAEGLIATGRGSELCLTDSYVRLRAKAGGFYWISFDGRRLLRGDEVSEAEPLQPKFADAMSKAAEGMAGRNRPEHRFRPLREQPP